MGKHAREFEVDPSAFPGADFRHEWVYANGHRFHVASTGEGDRLALCLHGFPECWYSWRYQLPLLARLGYRVWAPDLRGYGLSDRPHGVRSYTTEKLVEDVAGLIDASGARSVLLLAHDWGAVLAWLFAIRKLRPLEGLVIMNVPHPGAMSAGGFNWRQLLRSWYIFFFQIPWLPEWLLRRRNYWAIAEAFRSAAIRKERFPDPVLDVYRRNAAIPGALTAMVNWYRGLIRGGSARRQRKLGFPTIETRTLMIWGEHDPALGKETTYETHRFVRDLELRYLPVSHWVQQEAPDEVNALLEAWLAKEELPSET